MERDWIKTLLLFGSLRKNGDTAALAGALVRHLEGEVRILSGSDSISPCRDCRFCWSHPGCSIRDAMQEIYPYWEECDNVVLASPIWFSSLSGPLLSLASRFQTQFAARHFRNEPVGIKQKNGVILLVGAESGTEAVPIQTACTILKWMQVRRPCSTVCSLDTNRLPAARDERALSEARLAAERLNERYRKEGQGPHL